MATADLFNREVSASKSPRNAFDISYSTIFSSPVGLLSPAYVEEVNRGDKIVLGCESITRTRPCNTAAFMSFDQKVDFWFVPWHLIWSDYENWRIGQSYRHRTTELSSPGAQNLLPFCRFVDIANFLKGYTLPSGSDVYFKPSAATALRYLDLLMYANPRMSQWTLQINQVTPNGAEPVLSAAAWYTQLSSQYFCNYFRLAAFQCIYQHAYRNDMYEAQDPSYYNVDNLFDNLDTNNTIPAVSKVTTSSPTQLAVNDASSSPNARIDLSKLFTPRYKNWRDDVFVKVVPNIGISNDQGLVINPQRYNSGFNGLDFLWSPFVNDVGSPSTSKYVLPSNSVINGDNINPNGFIYSMNAYQVYSNLYTNVKVTENTGVGYARLYPQVVRNLMAQDRFVRASMYADRNYRDQVKALFGESVEDPHRPKYLGSYSTNVGIQEVVANSAGSDGDSSSPATSVLGEIAGKGYQSDSSDKVFSREFDCDGVIIGVHYIIPRNNYDSYRLARQNFKVSRWDFFYPQFDGLGLSPVYNGERAVTSNGANSNALYGFAPRYFEYKQRVNEVHGSFQSLQPDYDWTLTNNFNPSVDASALESFKVVPTCTNPIFSVAYDGSPASDPFFSYFNYRVTRVSNMEVYGTPQI